MPNTTGEYREIYNKWLGVLEPGVRWEKLRRILLTVGGALVLTAAVTLWFFLLLRRQVRRKTAELSVANRELGEARIEALNKMRDAQQAKEKTAASEMRFKALHNASFGGIVIHDEGLILDCNQGLSRITGYSQQELIGMDGLLLFAEQSRPWVMERILAGTEEPYEAVGVRKNRQEYPVRLQGRQIPYHGKEVRVVEFRDITEQKEAEQALRESEEMMRTSQAVAHIGSYSTDLNLHEIDTSAWVCSPELYNVFGIDESYPHTIAGWADFIHPDHREELVNYHEAVIKQKTSFSKEYKIIRINDGAERWVHGTGELEFDGTGTPVRMYGAIQDITERKQAEADLQRLSTAIEQSPEVVIITDTKGTIQYVNPAFTAITGYTSEEAIGQNTRILKSGKNNSAFYTDIWNTLLAGEVWNGELVNKRKDGTLYTEEASIAPVKDASGTITNFVAIKRDITEELQKEELYRQSQKMKSVGQLAGGIAHDFNNILQAITGFSEMLEIALADDLPPVYADAGQLSQVVINLSVNARDAMDGKGRFTINASKTEWCSEDADHTDNARSGLFVELSFTDTGDGMSEEVRKRLFEPFFTTKEVGRGTGLGLSVVYGIVQQHKGWIEVESEVGQGTCFRVYLPAAEQDTLTYCNNSKR